MALPLLPEPLIEKTYDSLITDLSTTMRAEVNDLLSYYPDQWFVKVPTTQWCLHGLSMRTNNNPEEFHSHFNRPLLIYHPNMWSFIKLLQEEENRFNHMLTQFNADLGARTKQKKTIGIQHRINNLDQRYYEGVIDIMEYLDGLSYTVAKRKKR